MSATTAAPTGRIRSDTPLTEAQRAVVEGHQWIVLRVVKDLANEGRIRHYQMHDAVSIGLRMCVAAARKHDPTRAKFSTYLWHGLRRDLTRRLRDAAVRERKRPHAKEAPADRTLSRQQGREREPWEDAASDEGVERAWAALDECERALPAEGGLLKRVVTERASVYDIARELGVPRTTLQHRIVKAREWMAERLGVEYRTGARANDEEL